MLKRFVLQTVIALTLLLVCTETTQSQTRIDTTEKFKYDRQNQNVEQDCSVRALATAFDISYDDALKMLGEYLIKDEGIKFKDLAKVIDDSGYEHKHSRVNRLLPKDFIKVASKGTYLIITQGHIFTLKYENDQWLLYGDKVDYKSEIIYAIKITEV